MAIFTPAPLKLISLVVAAERSALLLGSRDLAIEGIVLLGPRGLGCRLAPTIRAALLRGCEELAQHALCVRLFVSGVHDLGLDDVSGSGHCSSFLGTGDGSLYSKSSGVLSTPQKAVRRDEQNKTPPAPALESARADIDIGSPRIVQTAAEEVVMNMTCQDFRQQP